MKTLTKWFLVAELLDVATTFIAIGWFGAIELNPFGLGIALIIKLFVTLITVIALEKIKNIPNYFYIVPVAAVLPAIWNIFELMK